MRSYARCRNVLEVNHASDTPATLDNSDLSIVMEEHLSAVRGFWFGRLGQTVRCVPWRRTMMAVSGSETLYAKLYRRKRRIAKLEWYWLHALPVLGFETAQPVAWVADRESSLVVTSAVTGRSLDSWAVDAAADGWLDGFFSYVCREVAPFARRLHDHQLIHRDFNCHHLFATHPLSAGPPAVIDVERMFRSRWNRRRWVVKDLASLMASVPVPVPPRVAFRFLKTYAPDLSSRQLRRFVRTVAAKVVRILSHQPRFG